MSQLHSTGSIIYVSNLTKGLLYFGMVVGGIGVVLGLITIVMDRFDQRNLD